MAIDAFGGGGSALKDGAARVLEVAPCHADKPFVVVVTNAELEADEFEMLIPAVERELRPGEQGRLRIEPLGAGRFAFFGESDPDEEKGVIISE